MDDMRETMVDADGVGLAAPQIGILRRVVVIDIGEGLVELVKIQRLSMKKENKKCRKVVFLVPCIWYDKTRPAKSQSVCSKQKRRAFLNFEAEELFAVACCHEIDHLNGILFREHVVRMVAEDGHTLP